MVAGHQLCQAEQSGQATLGGAEGEGAAGQAGWQLPRLPAPGHKSEAGVEEVG